MKALEKQIGGTHYSEMAIQPVEYIYANNIDYWRGTAIAYLSRDKLDPLEDVKKAIHTLQLYVELVEKDGAAIRKMYVEAIQDDGLDRIPPEIKA